jgi:hypothetical protein
MFGLFFSFSKIIRIYTRKRKSPKDFQFFFPHHFATKTTVYPPTLILLALTKWGEPWNDVVFHLVPHFEECSTGVTMNCEFHLLRTSWNVSYLNCCYFEFDESISAHTVKWHEQYILCMKYHRKNRVKCTLDLMIGQVM